MLSSSISVFGSVGGFVILMSFNLKKEENKIFQTKKLGARKSRGFEQGMYSEISIYCFVDFNLTVIVKSIKNNISNFQIICVL